MRDRRSQVDDGCRLAYHGPYPRLNGKHEPDDGQWI